MRIQNLRMNKSANKLVEAVIYSEHGEECKVRYKDKVIGITIEKGEFKTLDSTNFKLNKVPITP